MEWPVPENHQPIIPLPAVRRKAVEKPFDERLVEVSRSNECFGLFDAILNREFRYNFEIKSDFSRILCPCLAGRPISVLKIMRPPVFFIIVRSGSEFLDP